jgi:NADH-quinone oxidoreductase subunit N
MSSRDLIAILPLIIPAYAGVVLMLVTAFVRSPRLALWLTLVGFAAAFASVFVALPYSPRMVTPLVRIDAYSLVFAGVILAAAFLVTLLCGDYLRAHEKRGEAFYVLMVFAVTGMLVVAASAHFASFFLGLETLSVSLYGLIGYTRRSSRSLEAAIKYLIMAAVSSAFLLFGIALIYADFGTMDFARLAAIVSGGGLGVVSWLGLGLALVGFGFKLAWVPFHTWSPDVYQGAPAPVTALIASGSKGAVFALLLRLTSMSHLQGQKSAFLALAVLAVATMFVGNLLALSQNNVKRLLAYSSIAQMGYLLIPLIAGGANGASSAVFYLVSYMAATIAAFGVISIVSASRETGDVDSLADYVGLAGRSPWLAAVFAVALLSLMGMPLTAGFFAKFYIFTSAAQAGLWWLLVVGAINTGMSAFYYLRVVFALYSRSESEPAAAPNGPSVGAALSLAVCAAVIVLLGVYPTPLLRLAEAAARSIGF